MIRTKRMICGGFTLLYFFKMWCLYFTSSSFTAKSCLSVPLWWANAIVIPYETDRAIQEGIARSIFHNRIMKVLTGPRKGLTMTSNKIYPSFQVIIFQNYHYYCVLHSITGRHNDFDFITPTVLERKYERTINWPFDWNIIPTTATSAFLLPST